MTRFEGRDNGAIAVVVAICAVLLIGMAAFAVDFGNAFATKRQLSVASDAAAIAGARAINASVPPGTTCDPAALQPIAQAAAETANSQNDTSGESAVTEVTVECENGQAFVTVANERTVPTFFGSVFGADGYTPATKATAQLYVPAAISGLRPIAACEASVLDAWQPSMSPPVVKPFLVTISNEDAVCGTAHSGDWGIADFYEQGEYGTYEGDQCNGDGGSAPCQSAWTSDGYGGPVYFPNLITGEDTGLGGSTGVAGSSAFRYALGGLVDKVILLPVADRYSESTEVKGQDRLNLVGVVAVRVCSVNWNKEVSPGVATECASSRVPTEEPDVTTWNEFKGGDEGGLWVIPTDYVTSGVAKPNEDCDITDPTCGLVRAVRLYK